MLAYAKVYCQMQLCICTLVTIYMLRKYGSKQFPPPPPPPPFLLQKRILLISAPFSERTDKTLIRKEKFGDFWVQLLSEMFTL